MSRVLTEITPLSDKDCFYLVDRNKTEFDYPLHRHPEFELNFVSNCTGARRIVGDSVEVIGEYDLALVGPGLEHCWEQNVCDHSDKREITIQFAANLFGSELMDKHQLRPIKKLLENARTGLAFGMHTIMLVYSKLENLSAEQTGFTRLIRFMEVLNELACAEDVRQLATVSFSDVHISTESRRINKVEEVIAKQYATELRLEDLASLANMTPTAFSRFFKKRTGRTLTEYIIDVRIGHAVRMLVDTNMTVSEICFASGFNNISNFNRIFKRLKGCAPRQFRENYLKTKLIV